MEFDPNGAGLGSEAISPAVAQTNSDETGQSESVDRREWFWRSFPPKWRFVMVTLSIIASAHYAFLLFGLVYFDDLQTNYFLAVGWMWICLIWLVREAVIAGNPLLESNPSYKKQPALLFVFLLAIFMLVFSTTAFFNHAEQSEKSARLIWEISEYCYEDGEFVSERAKQCLQFKSALREPLCLLGAEPMNACELELRRTLNK